jgi:hypothetical protein
MAYLIDRIKKDLAEKGFDARTREARMWLFSEVRNLKPNPRTIMQDREHWRNSESLGRKMIGRMYFFFYDPKTKEKMPYYDRFPLVIPIQLYNDGFLGLNLHYIHYKMRIRLLDKMSSFLVNTNFDETTRFRLKYQTLNAASRIFEHTPCIKRYLYSNIKSKFLEITADKWDIAALLPVERFKTEQMKKVNRTQVYAESRKKF